MKTFIKKYGHMVSSVAFFCAVFFANTGCTFRGHQPKLPERAKSLRKF